MSTWLLYLQNIKHFNYFQLCLFSEVLPARSPIRECLAQSWVHWTVDGKPWSPIFPQSKGDVVATLRQMRSLAVNSCHLNEHVNEMNTYRISMSSRDPAIQRSNFPFTTILAMLRIAIFFEISRSSSHFETFLAIMYRQPGMLSSATSLNWVSLGRLGDTVSNRQHK